jgi:hypothetical protein
MCTGQLVAVFVLSSAAIGLFAGILARMPGDGLLLGLLHAVIPSAIILDEVHS